MGTNKRYFWLKLKDNFFSQPKIKKLRKIAGGDTYTIIYLKMQLLSLKNDGKLYFDGIEDNFVEEIALTIDEDVENVNVTIQFLKIQGLLVEVNADEYEMTETIENIGSETASTIRSRKSRKAEKALQCNTNATPTQQLATKCNTEIEIEKEKEKEIEKRDREINYQLIADMYNDTCVSFPKLTKLSDYRKKAIKARLNTYSIDDFKELFEKAENSRFLKGGNARNWQANFDWMIKDANMAKILDGNYDDKTEHRKVNTGISEQEQNMLDDLF